MTQKITTPIASPSTIDPQIDALVATACDLRARVKDVLDRSGDKDVANNNDLQSLLEIALCDMRKWGNLLELAVERKQV